MTGIRSERAFRDVLGQFATGVTVITTTDGQGRPCAITVNSFSSLSLDPPLVLWCLGQDSRRFNSFIQAQRFAIHILADNQLALGLHFSRDGLAFDGQDWHTDAAGLPFLPGCAARLSCDLSQTIAAGDHHIILGQVFAAEQGTRTPLVFAQGSYGRFAPDQGPAS